MLIIHDPSPILKSFMDPRDQPVFPAPVAVLPPEHLFMETQDRLRWRQERAAILVDLWQRDRRGFDLLAGECIWEDPQVAALLPADAAAAAIRLVSQAAIRLHRQAR